MYKRFILHYHLMKSSVRQSFRFFYRRHTVVGFEDVPRNASVVFVANHQNSLIDAINIVVVTPPIFQPCFMTRSDVFNEKSEGFLRSIKMLPIYRQRDGLDSIAKNEEVFKIVDEELQNPYSSMIIFPEGSHDTRRLVRPLKKGAARMIFQAAQTSDYTLPLYVVPVGLNYSDHDKFHSDLLIIFGKPIDVRNYYDLHRQSPARAINVLTADIHPAMAETLIHIPDEENLPLIDSLRKLFTLDQVQEMGLAPHKALDRFKADKAVVARMEETIAAAPEQVPAIAEAYKTYEAGLAALGIRDHVIRDMPHHPLALLGQVLALLLTLPVFLYGAVNHYHLYRLCYWIPRKVFKDPQFHFSVMWLSGYFLYPVSWLLQTLVVGLLTNGPVALAYLVSLPLTGLGAMAWTRGYKKLIARIKVTFGGKAAAENLKQQRASLRDMVWGKNKL
ncbi:MAG: 1-acyl-sn-glycerol-3-phosphate acyltransferase [Bacteroidia bacterium]|nr:1-acyl-sn-glycerol-3-phosphate acyltransferase [Bacteroidia bacterium]